jgi:dienelactone hydrolase
LFTAVAFHRADFLLGYMTNRADILRQCAWLCMLALSASPLVAQPFGEPDRGHPADAMIQGYMKAEAEEIEADFLAGIKSAEGWNEQHSRWRQEYFDMLGLWPIPEKTPLQATITHTLDRGDYFIDMLHYQSRPGLYVTANVYRPAKIAADERLPGVLYVCGHESRTRHGNKTAFQSHGIWFARHGYVCLIVDTLQFGEIAGTHHGTYRDGRCQWLSRGYTTAGIECWNGIRAIDYLLSRADVDPQRIGVTGISGGGAATFWIAAADERVKIAAPVSGMADLIAYVPNRVINGHCDCIFLYNTYQWPWTRIAGLIAPRPMLFVNSDRDWIFPMDANQRVINRLERLYSLFGAGELVDSVVSVGAHEYRKDIRQAVFRFFNTHLKNDPRLILDSEVDLVAGPPNGFHPIPPQQLRVFPDDTDIPNDALNARIDQEFVPIGQVEVPRKGAFESWKDELITRLRRMSFHHFPERIPAARSTSASDSAEIIQVETEPGISVRIRAVRSPPDADRVVMLVSGTDVESDPPAWLDGFVTKQDAIYVCEPRGMGGKPWTRDDSLNYVERSHYLLGRTVDSGRIWDIAAAARYLKARHHGDVSVNLFGESTSAVLALYAALLEPEVAGLVLLEPAGTHMSDSAASLLNVLRVCDIPDVLGMLAPRPVTIITDQSESFQKANAIYRAAEAVGKLVVRP